MPTDDRLGFVPQGHCNCKEDPHVATPDGWHSHSPITIAWIIPPQDDGFCYVCNKCRAELAIFPDADGKPQGYVRRAGFAWDVAWKAVRGILQTVSDMPEQQARVGTELAIDATVRWVLERDGLNAQADGATMAAGDDTDAIQH